MRVKAIIHSATGPNPSLPRILRTEADRTSPAMPVAQAAPVAMPKPASTL